MSTVGGDSGVSGDEWEPSTDAQRRAVADLSDREAFSNADARTIVRFAHLPEAERDPDMLVHRDGADEPDNLDGITSDECKQIRRRMADADRPSDVVDDYPDRHSSEIWRHAQGRCNHDHGVGATTSPRVQAKECHAMRRAFTQDDEIDDILTDFSRSQNAVVKHVFGRCDHDLSHYERGTVPKRECNRMRIAYSMNTNITVSDLSAAFTLSRGATHAHLRGDCSHEFGVPAVDPTVVDAVSAAACDRLRTAFEDFDSVADLAASNRVDLHYRTILTHVFGRCTHDGDVPPATNDGAGRPTGDTGVDPGTCADMRNAYKRDTDRPTAAIADDVGVGKGTLYYHVFGRCAHDTTAETPAESKRGHG